jgi:nuclear mRNA export protein PCID2/THP1
LANQLFTNISTNSFPLRLYPASQRVTYLYYLGRFNLTNNHFHRAAVCLEQAYLETPPQLVSHRKRILTYLIPSSLFMGRLPTNALLRRPEAESLAPIFIPIATSIRTGNFVLFQHSLAANESWLLDKGLLIPFTHRLRPFLWRSLARRVFLLTYVPSFQIQEDSSSRKAAVLDLSDLHTAAIFQQHLLEGYVLAPSPTAVPGPLPNLRAVAPSDVSPMFLKAVRNSAAEAKAGADHGVASIPSTLVAPAGGPRRLRPNEGLVWGNAEVTMGDVEMAVLSLVDCGLLHGYVAHSAGKFAIQGGKSKGGPLAAGWPSVAQAIRERTYLNGQEVDWENVPGWKKA